MRLSTPINAADHVGEKSYDLIPPGWYLARITEAGVKPTKAGTGEYIALRYDILGPTHQGRIVYGNLNISNPNPAAERIGREQLSDLMRAIGLAAVVDSDQLIGGVCQIKLAIQPGSGQYSERNEVKGFKASSSAPPTSAPVDKAPSTPKAMPSMPAWVKKGAV
jgi:hypothetical protein